MTNSTLKPDLIVETIRKLRDRISERFPDSGLTQVCQQVHAISKNMQARADWIGRPVLWLRVIVWAVILVIVVLAISPFYMIQKSVAGELLGTNSFSDLVQLMEAGINDLVLIGAAIFFLLTFESRYKRERALKALHELRSLAHVIDMHQLTKDPHRIMGMVHYRKTGLSPKLEMSRFELHRYLDYCSEMLALIGKIAAVYVQEFDDSDAMAAASEVETLTTGLSQKIWQKIAILSTVEHAYGSDSLSPPAAVDVVPIPGTSESARESLPSPPNPPHPPV